MIRLSAKGRPTEVEKWLGKQDDPNIHVSDVTAFGTSWIAWWAQCQPIVRSNAGWPPPRADLQKDDWGKLVYGGKNGIFLFVMATAWWANGIDSAKPPTEFCQAIADLKWVLEQLNRCSIPPPIPPPPPETTLGKRQVRLSTRAAESSGRLKKMFKR